MKHLGKKGLTMSDAQSISNAVNQTCVDIDSKIENFNVTSKSVKIDGEVYETQEANPICDIFDLLKTKSILHGVQAFLMEALDEKKSLMNSIINEEFDEGILTYPTREDIPFPKFLEPVDETYGWSQLSAAEQAEYWDEESKASHHGKFIHKGGKLTRLRSELSKVKALEWELIEDGKKTPVRVIKHHNSDELLDIHNSIADKHTKANKRVNYFKAKIKNLTSAENQRIHTENARLRNEYNSLVSTRDAQYQMELTHYNSQLKELSSVFYADKEKRLNEASALRIVVAPRFQAVIDEYKVD